MFLLLYGSHVCAPTKILYSTKKMDFRKRGLSTSTILRYEDLLTNTCKKNASAINKNTQYSYLRLEL